MNGNEILINARNEKRLNHDDIAQQANISRSYYTNIENENKIPSIKVALVISNILDIDPLEAFPEVFKDLPKKFLGSIVSKRNNQQSA